LIVVIMLVLTGIFAAINNMGTEYYQLIDEEDYDSFIWIKQNTEPTLRILCDPWKARALAPVAERVVYAVMPFGPVEEQLSLVYKANQFFMNNCSNTSFLIENNIDIIYTRDTCKNENLTEVQKHIYLFEQN